MSPVRRKEATSSRSTSDEQHDSHTASEDGEVDKSPSPSHRSVEHQDAPPLPSEEVPPLSDEALVQQDDGWDPVWDDTAQAFYFYNRFTQTSQWTNPRFSDVSQQPAAPGVANHNRMPSHAPGTDPPPDLPIKEQQRSDYGGYNPAIHGDYDPTAPYAQPQIEDPALLDPSDPAAQAADPSKIYTATGTFNRFTGKWQAHDINPENHNDENKSRRQMSAFFDVDAAANSHNGKSLKAERSGKKLSKQELKAFKEKRKERKEEKRRAWLRD